MTLRHDPRAATPEPPSLIKTPSASDGAAWEHPLDRIEVLEDERGRRWERAQIGRAHV